jgi:mono/diheme cytochrome c family protein
MKNFLVIFILVIIAVNVYGSLFGDDRQSGRNAREFPTVQQTREVAETQVPQESSAVMTEVSLEKGTSIYDHNCAACHGRDGGVVVGPALADNDQLADTTHVLKRILNGKGSMPAFGNRFSDEEIANVASFIRSSWDNEFGPIKAEDVATQR